MARSNPGIMWTRVITFGGAALQEKMEELLRKYHGRRTRVAGDEWKVGVPDRHSEAMAREWNGYVNRTRDAEDIRLSNYLIFPSNLGVRHTKTTRRAWANPAGVVDGDVIALVRRWGRPGVPQGSVGLVTLMSRGRGFGVLWEREQDGFSGMPPAGFYAKVPGVFGAEAFEAYVDARERRSNPGKHRRAPYRPHPVNAVLAHSVYGVPGGLEVRAARRGEILGKFPNTREGGEAAHALARAPLDAGIAAGAKLDKRSGYFLLPDPDGKFRLHYPRTDTFGNRIENPGRGDKWVPSNLGVLAAKVEIVAADARDSAAKALDAGTRRMYEDDAGGYSNIASDLRAGRYAQALASASRMDTAARDMLPIGFWPPNRRLHDRRTSMHRPRRSNPGGRKWSPRWKSIGR